MGHARIALCRHALVTVSALLAPYEMNPPAFGVFLSHSFCNAFFDASLHKLLNKQSCDW